MFNLANFYDNYHSKNKKYSGVINKNNFTYFYINELLQKGCIFGANYVLDVGCGVGTIAIYLAHLGKNVVGIDISKRAIDIAKDAVPDDLLNKLIFRKVELDKFKSKNKNKFDLVICAEVLEHIEDDKTFLKDIFYVLKPGGYLVLTTPTPESLMYRWGMYKRFDLEVGHLRRYTGKQIKKIISSTGFDVVFFRQTESILRSSLFTTRLGFLIKFIRGPLVPIFHKLDEFVGLFFGFTDNQVIARK